MTAQAQAPTEFLVFEASGQRYGIAAADVRELVRAVTIVPLPHAPAIIEGIINVRGQIVPVLDIRTRFRLPSSPLSLTDHFVVAQAGDRTVALRADRAVDIARLEPGSIEDAKKIVPAAEYVAGVARLADGLLLIHDLATFLSEAESAAVSEALAPTGGTPTS